MPSYRFLEAEEEVGYDGYDGCSFAQLISNLKARNPRAAELYATPQYQQSLLTHLLDHEDVVARKVSTKGVITNIPDRASEPVSFCEEQGKLPHRQLNFRMTNDYIISLLNLWPHPELYKNELKMKLIMAIAKKRVEGYWQFLLAKDMNIQPKIIFQHLKPLYRHEVIVKLPLILPQTSKSRFVRSPLEEKKNETNTVQGQSASSGVLWLKRFFEANRVPPELIRMHMTQQIIPFKSLILGLLSSQKNGLLLERDVRSYFLSFFVSSENRGTFLSSGKTISRFYIRMRRELLEEGVVHRVRAWCPQTSRLELCMMIATTPELSARGSDSTPKAAQVDLLVETTLSSTTAGSDFMEDDLASAPIISDQFVTTAETSPKSPFLPCDDVRNGEEDEDVSKIDVEENVEVDESAFSDIPFSRHLSIPRQVYEILLASGSEGIVTPCMADCLHTTPKKLTKVLATLEKGKFVVKKAQRHGKCFMYRYFLAGNAHSPSPEKNYSDEQQEIMKSLVANSKSPAARQRTRTDGRSACRKTMTEQFCERVHKFKEWVRELKVCTIPELARRYANSEKTPNGPDRKTIMRVTNIVFSQDPSLRKGVLLLGQRKTQEILFFYDSAQFASESEAAEHVAKALTQKRSEACKDAVRRNNSIYQALKERTKEELDGRSEETTISILGALQSENARITNWSESKNPVNKYGGYEGITCSQPIVPDLHVEPQLDLIISNGQRQPNTRHDQKLLSHYGFLFPVMIRLKLFHLHVLNTVLANNGTISSPGIKLNSREILDNMSIDTFLRIIGHSRRNQFIENYLHGSVNSGKNGDSRKANGNDITLGSLPPDVYFPLVSAGKINVVKTWSRKPSYRAIQKLFSKMFLLGLVSFQEDAQSLVDNDDPDDVDARDIESLRLEAIGIDLTSSSRDRQSYELQEEPLPWLKEEDEGSETSPKVQKWQRSVVGRKGYWVVNLDVKLMSFVLHVDQSPDLLEEFNMRKPGEVDAYWTALRQLVDVWIYERKALDPELEPALEDTSSTHRDSMKPKTHVRPPANLPLSEAFSKRNWKGQLLLSADARAKLGALAKEIIRKSEETPDDVELESLSILNPDSEDIRQCAQSIQLGPDSVLRYLLRYFSTAGDARLLRIANSKIGGVTLSTTKDLKYRCHVCGMLYAQKPSLIGHYKDIHQQQLPENEKQYVLPRELERRKRKSLTFGITRRKRRVRLGATEEDDKSLEELYVGGEGRPQSAVNCKDMEKHIHRLLSSVDYTKLSRSLEGGSEEASKILVRRSWEGTFDSLELDAQSILSMDVHNIAELSVLSSDDEHEKQTVETSTAFCRTPNTFLQHIMEGYSQHLPSTASKETNKALGKTKSQRLKLLNVTASKLYHKYRLRKREREDLRRFLQGFRRDDEYSLIAFLVALERLKCAEQLWRKDSTPVNEQDSTPGSQAVFGANLPPLTDNFWDYFTMFQNSPQFPPAAGYFVAHYCLYRFSNTLNVRIMGTFRKLSGQMLHDAMINFIVPLKTALRDCSLVELPAPDSSSSAGNTTQLATSSTSQNPAVRLALGRNVLKVILFTNYSRYRSWWACEATSQCLTESEMSQIWNWWNQMGFVVPAKRPFCGSPKDQSTSVHKGDAEGFHLQLPSPTVHIRFWESLCKRRFVVSRGLHALLFGKLRTWKLSACKNFQLKGLCAKQAASHMTVQEFNPIISVGLDPSSIAALTEAIAEQQVDLAVCWSRSDTNDAEANADPVPDPYDGFSEMSGRAEPATTTLEVRQLANDLCNAIQRTSELPKVKREPCSDLPVGDFSPSSVPILVADFDDSEEEMELDEASSDESVPDSDDYTSKIESSRGVKGGGVQKHLLKLTKNAADMTSFWWRFRAQRAELPKPEERRDFARLFQWDIDMDVSLCGLATLDLTRLSHLDVLAIDPWLLPTNLFAVEAFRSSSAHNTHLLAERSLEFADDEEQAFSVAERARRSRARYYGFDSPEQPLTKRLKSIKSRRVQAETPSKEKIDAMEDMHRVSTVRGRADQDCSAEEFYDMVKQLLSERHGKELDRISGLRGALFTSTLIAVHYMVSKSGAMGGCQMDLMDAFCKDSIDSRYSGDHDAVHEDFKLSIRVLLALRCVARVACVTDWRIMSAQAALPYLIKLRPFLRPVDFVPELLSEGIGLSESPLYSGLRDGSFSDPLLKPPWITEEAWITWGPAPGTLEYFSTTYSSFELGSEMKQSWATAIMRDRGLATKLRKCQTAWANLRAACAESGFAPAEDSYLFLSTDFIGQGLTSSGTWTRLDGRLDSTLFAIFMTRIYQIVEENPCVSVGDIHRKIMFLDCCEVQEMVDSMTYEGLLSVKLFPLDPKLYSANVDAPLAGTKTSVLVDTMVNAADPCCRIIKVYSVNLEAIFRSSPNLL